MVHIYSLILIFISETVSQVRKRLNGVEKERLEAASRSNSEVSIVLHINNNEVNVALQAKTN